MGTMDHPIGELFEKVNDGSYHVVRFTRSGPNSTIQIDDLVMQTKNPQGRPAIQQPSLLQRVSTNEVKGQGRGSGQLGQRSYAIDDLLLSLACHPACA